MSAVDLASTCRSFLVVEVCLSYDSFEDHLGEALYTWCILVVCCASTLYMTLFQIVRCVKYCITFAGNCQQFSTLFFEIHEQNLPRI
jgi:hypothetical protein